MAAQISEALRVGIGSLGAFQATPPDCTHLQPSWASQVPGQPRAHPPLPVEKALPPDSKQISIEN